MTTPDTSAVYRTFAALARTQAELYDLEFALDERTADLTHQLRLLGMDLHTAGELVDPDLVHRLYWETPSVPAQAIYEAFGLRSPSDVSRIAGAHEFGLPCKDCKVVVTYQVKNRTVLRKLRSNHRCEDCAAKEAERERQAHARYEALERAMVAYVLAHPDLPDEPENAAMYVEIPVSEWGGSTVSLGDLNAVRDQLHDRLRPATPKG
jgi:hypothetical protein